MHYVADKLDLRKDIQFNTTIKSAHFNEATGRWTITTDKGQVIDAQYPGHLLRHAVRTDVVAVPRTGDIQGRVVPHRPLAERSRSISPASGSASSVSARPESR